MQSTSNLTGQNNELNTVQAAMLKASIEESISKLLAIAVDPVELRISDKINIELMPSSDGDDRVYVGHDEWGYTKVFYTHEGVLVEVQGADECAEPVLDVAIGWDELVKDSDD